MQQQPHACIRLAALRHNFARIQQWAPNSKVMAVIKSNAYGHGDVAVAKALPDCDAFAVATLAEAVRLRQAGIRQDIVLLEGVQSEAQYQQAVTLHLTPVIHEIRQLGWLETYQGTIPACWIMVETGMNRLGFPPKDIALIYHRIKKSHRVTGDIGLMSHFANADNPDDQRNQQQLERLSALTLFDTLPVSMANSAAIVQLPESQLQWVRPGLMLYGASPFLAKDAKQLGLQAVMTVKAQIIAIKVIQAGEQVGYGGDYTAATAKKIGIINMGYGDGLSRQLSNRGFVLWQQKRLAILGRISMDMTCIDLTASTAAIGDEVTIWGESMPIEATAMQAGTIPYELFCQLTRRIPRLYDGKS